MTDVQTIQREFERFLQVIPESAQPWLQQIRESALTRAGELGLPTRKDEAWKYTSVARLRKTEFRQSFELPAPGATAAALVQSHILPELGAHRLVFVNGWFSAELSDTGSLPDAVTICPINEAIQADRKAVEPHLARIALFERAVFTALNTIFFHHGSFVQIPRGHRLDRPIHLLHVSTASEMPFVTHPRTLLVVEEGSSAVVVESYAGEEGGVYFTNPVTEVVLKDGASLEHYKVQQESKNAVHIATIDAQQGRDSSFTSHSTSIGGGLVRNDINTRLGATGASCSFLGLFAGTGEQHIDNHTLVDHAMPHGTSSENYKGILDGRATGVFNGKVLVRKDAQKTNAAQANRNLILSRTAQINTKPELEIYADDVKCTHGATIGQLDATALFYLQSRGLSQKEARRILIHGFANELLEKIELAPLRAVLERQIHARLSESKEDA